MSVSNDLSYFGTKDFIHFLSNCDNITFEKAITYINIKGFYEGLYDYLLFDDRNLLIEAMEFADSSYASIRDYLEAKYNVKIY